MKPKLNIMIGIPGCGKTTYAVKNLLNNKTVYLSSDEMRLELFNEEFQGNNELVFNTMQKRCKEALNKFKMDVIYDATNLSIKKRKNLIDMMKKYAEINAYLVCCPINIILERNMTRIERKLPWDKLEMMIKSIDCPMYYEGFNNIYLIDGGMYNDVYDYNFMIKKCEGYKQDNPYHNETLDNHIQTVIKKFEEYNIDVESSNILRQAARYHDLWKPYCRVQNTKGYSSYYNHEKLSTYGFLCHIMKQRLLDDLQRVRLCDSDYQVAVLVLNHMEWYKRDNMSVIKEKFNDDDLYHLLELLHEADKYREGISNI